MITKDAITQLPDFTLVYTKSGVRNSEPTYLALLNITIPGDTDEEDWYIDVSFPNRGPHTDTGASTRMFPGNISASINL